MLQGPVELKGWVSFELNFQSLKCNSSLLYNWFKVPPAQSADTAERELRSSTVANLNSEERVGYLKILQVHELVLEHVYSITSLIFLQIGKILDKAAKGLHAVSDRSPLPLFFCFCSIFVK